MKQDKKNRIRETTIESGRGRETGTAQNIAAPFCPAITRRRSAEKTILRFVRNGILNYRESIAAYAFLALVENFQGHSVKLHSFKFTRRSRGPRYVAGDGHAVTGLSAKHRYHQWCAEMAAQGLEAVPVLDFILNGVAFSQLDKKAGKQNGWSRQQFITGMRIFENIYYSPTYNIDTLG